MSEAEAVQVPQEDPRVDFVQEEATPAAPVYPKIISVEDRLRAENLQYKMQNTQLQLQLLQADIQRAVQTRTDLVAAMNSLRQEFLTRYGVDLAQVKINDDGTFEQLPPRTG